MGQKCGSHGSSAVVLLVENDVLKRTTKAGDLRREGFEVFEASDMAEAVAVLEATAIDVVFSDIDLIDGPALAQAPYLVLACAKNAASRPLVHGRSIRCAPSASGLRVGNKRRKQEAGGRQRHDDKEA
jgi:hypothetical protein